MKSRDYNEQEYEYADELNERRSEKRSRTPEIRKEKEKRKKKMSGSCCILILVIMGMAFYLIYFVLSQLSGPIQEEWAKRKIDLQNLPETFEELKTETENRADEGKKQLEPGEVNIIDNTMPLWASKMILNEENYAPNRRCDYADGKIYIGVNAQSDCFDCFLDQIYDQNGQILCSTGGDVNGNGDSQCSDLPAAAGNCQIWNGERWERTVWE